MDITEGICSLLEQLTGKRDLKFSNLYRRCVSYSGNTVAQYMINDVFKAADGVWRGIGSISNSALILNEKYEHLDAAKRFGLDMQEISNPQNCLCSEILLGIKLPHQCRYFGTGCTPDHPSGPCMVSSEGVCAVHFRYGGAEGSGR
jgi:hydrogenase expression/formation protein HypD